MSKAADQSQAGQQVVNVADLDLTSLAEVRRQLEDEVSHLTTSFQRLKQAQAKFQMCLENVAEIKLQNKDKVILVPLTNSLYAPGKLADPENVIVDVGTGYYVQKSRIEAQKHYGSKIDHVRSNLEPLQDTIQKKQDNLNYVINIMQAKIQAQAQSAGADAGKEKL